MVSWSGGRPVVVLRHPARSVRIADALRAGGMAAYALPLTDTELPADTDAVARALAALGQGGYEWLVLTSANAVQVLGILAGADTLATLVRRGGARVAAVGTATARTLAAAGVVVDLVPGEASSAGLLAAFPSGRGAVLLPQADLAPDDLRAGLADSGRAVHRVEAYRTVPYPASTMRRVPGVEEDGPRPPVLSLRDLVGLASGGVQPAVVFTAPSAVRQFHDRLGDGPLSFRAVAIGRTTAGALRSGGWAPAATAADPTPQGIARAAADALAQDDAPISHAAPSNGDQP
ncbi:uroporphyrinogen-III synthase [Arthrobacter antioxidans]|uniref:uroporphyrinogen-III synthase n=1 Tax=Arthrobacter antioxidans TaxID=2895818 RepID=UPI002000086E|nr:uroporphyrinogen-III synthase [Arthrobacter antioxidans]